jgi:hypothetical protein
MTGNCAALQSLADEPGRVQMNPRMRNGWGSLTNSWCGSAPGAGR